MQVDVHVEADSVTELETAARAEVDKIADGRPYTLQIEHASARSDRDYPTPVARMSAGYAPKRLMAYVTATFEGTS